MTGLLLAASALVPAFLLLWYFYSRDQNPEPKGMIAKAFLLGAVIVFPVIPCALGLQALGAGLTGMWGAALAKAFLGAAIPEESFKLLVLRGWAWRKSAFDEPMDGLVYGATASLGFAAFENLMYVGEGGLGIAALRAFTAVPGHALTGAIMGAYAGRAKFGKPGGSVVAGLGWAMLLHGLYDTFLFTKSAWALLALVVLVVEVIWVRRIVRTMRAEQAVPLPTLLAAPAPVPVGLEAPAAAMVAQPPPAVLAPSAAPASGTGWAIFKILAGGTGASAGSLLILLFCIAMLAPNGPTGGQVALLSGLVAVPTVLFLLLFRSGVRGPAAAAR